jgi:hypothetical protein
MRIRAFVLPVLLAVGLASCPDSGPKGPGETFDHIVELIRSGDFDGVWFHHAEEWRRAWAADMLEQDRIVHAAGENLEVVNQLLVTQYGMEADAFLRATPRRRFTAFLEVNRDLLLRYRLAGEPQVEEDRAWLKVDMDPELPPQEWVMVRRDGKWLVLETPDPARGR